MRALPRDGTVTGPHYIPVPGVAGPVASLPVRSSRSSRYRRTWHPRCPPCASSHPGAREIACHKRSAKPWNCPPSRQTPQLTDATKSPAVPPTLRRIFYPTKRPVDLYVRYGLPHDLEPPQQEHVLATPSHGMMHHYGDFYMLNDTGCRSTLEIVNSCVPANQRNQLLTCQPEIVVVMMNPGASEPREGGNGHHRPPHEIGSRACLVSTCPDDTQRAIAKVMRCKGFSHARVLNLSDVRQVESNRFLDDLKNDCLPPGHSVFCSERAGELRERLRSRSGIAIAAWGKDRRLRKLAETALVSFQSHNLRVHGWDNHPLFIHPARRPNQWPHWILSNWPN